MRNTFFQYSILAGMSLSCVLICTTVAADEPNNIPAAPTTTSKQEAPTNSVQSPLGDVEMDENAASSSDSTDTACLPACRGGFTCIQGRCLSPCNPQCDPGQICTRNGRCLAPLSQPTVINAAPAPLVPGTALPVVQVSADTIALNQRKYDAFKSKKSSGTAMMALGSMLIAVAVGLGAAAGASGEEALLFAGIGVEFVGDLLLFPGIAVYSVGKNGMVKAKANYYTSTNNLGVRFAFRF